MQGRYAGIMFADRRNHEVKLHEKCETADQVSARSYRSDSKVTAEANTTVAIQLPQNIEFCRC